jgi:hypothetical protein
MYFIIYFILIFFKRIYYDIINYFGYALSHRIKYCSDKTIDITQQDIRLSDIYHGKQLKLVIIGDIGQYTLELDDNEEKIPPRFIFNKRYTTPSLNDIYEKRIRNR